VENSLQQVVLLVKHQFFKTDYSSCLGLKFMSVMKKFGQKLRALRESRGLTLRQLADELGVTHPHLVHIEVGRRGPSIELLIKIARYFEVSTDDLLDDDTKLKL